MTGPLTVAGQDREIFLRALREYSERCEAPNLTPGCPYAHDLPGGGRWCLEECMTLLATHDAPPPVEEIKFGESIALLPRRPRSRRGPNRHTRPFDAREFYLDDSQISSDMTKWRPSSLFNELREALLWAGSQDVDERRRRIGQICNEMDRRGFDSAAIIQFGLSDFLAHGIVLAAALTEVLASEGPDASPVMEVSKSWMDLLGIEPVTSLSQDTMAERVAEVLRLPAVEGVRMWVQTAPLSDVIDWCAPPSLDEARQVPRQVDRLVADLARWFVHRFSSTYMQSWSIKSLRLEWKYQHGRLSTLCSDADMASRRIDEVELAKLLADADVRYAEAPDGRPRHAIAAADLVTPALKLLATSRPLEAAAVFEALDSVSPGDPVVLNNWGFCLMASDPARALTLLERASGLGSEDLVLSGNRLYCLLRLDRVATALELAERLIAAVPLKERAGGHMWSLTSPGEVTWVPDLRFYILDLIEDLSGRTGDEHAASHWRAVVAEARARLA